MSIRRGGRHRARRPAAGCKEALFTLGDKPELRYARRAMPWPRMGFASTLEYLRAMAEAVRRRNRPAAAHQPRHHDPRRMRHAARGVASMGIMLESAVRATVRKGMPHYGSPDKTPAVRLLKPCAAGQRARAAHQRHPDRHRRNAPRAHRSLLALRDLHRRARPPAGNHRAELPRQSRHEDGRCAGAAPSTNCCGPSPWRACVRRGDEHPGAAQPEYRPARSR
jgi:hypothetical protein